MKQIDPGWDALTVAKWVVVHSGHHAVDSLHICLARGVIAASSVSAAPATEERPTEGLPPDLARILRDPTITFQRDHEIRLADGRTLFEHLEEWRNAPSNTASAHIDAAASSVSAGAGQQTREKFLALQRYVMHRDGCPCATQAHAASDCSCGMYEALNDLRAALVGAGQVPADTTEIEWADLRPGDVFSLRVFSTQEGLVREQRTVVSVDGTKLALAEGGRVYEIDYAEPDSLGNRGLQLVSRSTDAVVDAQETKT